MKRTSDRPSDVDFALEPVKATGIALAALVMAAVLYLTLAARGLDPIAYLQLRLQWAPLILIGYAGTIWFAIAAWSVFWTLFWHRGQPLILKSGKLAFLNNLVWQMPTKQIRAITVGSAPSLIGRRTAICIEREDGTQHWLPVGLFQAPPEQVVIALRRLLLPS